MSAPVCDFLEQYYATLGIQPQHSIFGKKTWDSPTGTITCRPHFFYKEWATVTDNFSTLKARRVLVLHFEEQVFGIFLNNSPSGGAGIKLS
ncbi:MAG: hypothetical protein S4CHLAM123_07060 [Chlamydiales bacterium]|nr:hypothetical protein [Chlamydiales bacterium]